MRTPQIRYPSRPTGTSPSRPNLFGRALGLAGLLTMMLLAGCTAGGGETNVSPRADLEVNKDEGWTGDDFVFDATGSTDPDGKISSYKFDFGDGTPPVEVKDDEMAKVTHKFTRGGEFTVTLVVTDDGKENTGSLTSDDATNVAVNERIPVASTAVSAIPGNDTGARQEIPFTVYEKANRYELNLTFTSLLPTGSSEFEVRVVDPNNDTVGEVESVTVSPGTTGQTIDVEGLLTKQGVHRIVIEAKSGGGAADGELRIYYGEDVPR